jgi:hypothetical protein
MLSTKTLLTRLGQLDDETRAIYTRALASNDLRTALSAIREMREMVATYARVAPVQRTEVRAAEWSQSLRNLRTVSWQPMPLQPHAQPPQRGQQSTDPADPTDEHFDRLIDDVSDDAFNKLFDTSPDLLKRKRLDGEDEAGEDG